MRSRTETYAGHRSCTSVTAL